MSIVPQPERLRSHATTRQHHRGKGEDRAPARVSLFLWLLQWREVCSLESGLCSLCGRLFGGDAGRHGRLESGGSVLAMSANVKPM